MKILVQIKFFNDYISQVALKFFKRIFNGYKISVENSISHIVIIKPTGSANYIPLKIQVAIKFLIENSGSNQIL